MSNFQREQPARRGLARHEAGASLAEFVLVLPVLMALIYGSMYLTELGLTRLKAQEIARYGAFAFAQQPLSDFGNRDHTAAYNQARDRVVAELDDVYHDLDGAEDRLPAPRMTLSASYAASPGDLRHRDVQLVPDWGQFDWANPLSAIGVVLNTIGLGNGVESFFAGPFKRLDFNHRGRVEARAEIRVEPPIAPRDQRRARKMAQAGALRRADLSAFSPPFSIRDRPGERVAVTLIADSWRLQQGHSAHPKITDNSQRHYASMIEEITDNGLKALPGGTVINAIAQLMGITDNLPPEISQWIGIPQNNPGAHTVARPYANTRDDRFHFSGELQSGQVNVAREAANQTRLQERDAVTNFETMPLFDDPQNPGGSGYLESLNERGRYFMGCTEEGQRGCWER